MAKMIILFIVGIGLGYLIKRDQEKKELTKWLEEQRKLGKIK